MIISEEVKSFMSKLSSYKKFDNVIELLNQDIKKCKTDITTMILQGRLDLEANWSNYILSDVNILYNEDMLRVDNLLKMYGIRDFIYDLRGDDVALMVNYKFNLFDIYGGILDTITVLHITIMKASGDTKNYTNQWYLLYDH